MTLNNHCEKYDYDFTDLITRNGLVSVYSGAGNCMQYESETHTDKFNAVFEETALKTAPVTSTFVSGEYFCDAGKRNIDLSLSSVTGNIKTHIALKGIFSVVLLCFRHCFVQQNESIVCNRTVGKSTMNIRCVIANMMRCSAIISNNNDASVCGVRMNKHTCPQINRIICCAIRVCHAVLNILAVCQNLCDGKGNAFTQIPQAVGAETAKADSGNQKNNCENDGGFTSSQIIRYACILLIIFNGAAFKNIAQNGFARHEKSCGYLSYRKNIYKELSAVFHKISYYTFYASSVHWAANIAKKYLPKKCASGQRALLWKEETALFPKIHLSLKKNCFLHKTYGIYKEDERGACLQAVV